MKNVSEVEGMVLSKSGQRVSKADTYIRFSQTDKNIDFKMPDEAFTQEGFLPAFFLQSKIATV